MPGDWASGTFTIDASKIQNYLTNTPQRRHLFILDATTGVEYTPYAPVTWVSTTHGGNKRPPVIGGDGVIYTHIGYKNGDPSGGYPNMGASGGVAGWKFGTQYISRVYDFERGYADETVKFTAGGNLIYWSEGFNMPYGSFDVTMPYGTANYWDYTYCGGCLGIPNNGGDFEFTPYNGRVYMLDGNVLAALSTKGDLKDLGTVNPAQAAVPASSPIGSQVMQAKLEAEVSKILAAGPLRPGFHDSGFWGASVNGYAQPTILGDHISEYYHNPAETIYTLYRAYPHLPGAMQTQVVNYLKNNYSIGKVHDVTAYAHTGWRNGARREIFSDTPEITYVTQLSTNQPDNVIASIPRTYTQVNLVDGQVRVWNFPQDSFYGAWKYAQLVPAEAKAIFDAMKSKLQTSPLSDGDLLDYPYILNQYIIGYRGYMELEKMAGYTGAITASNKYAEYTRLLNLRMNNFSQSSPFSGLDYNRTLNEARNFMFLVPELAAEFASRLPGQVQTAVDAYSANKSYWFVNKYDNTFAEAVFEPLYTSHALFQARALILHQPYNTLVKYIDAPAFWRGDLYYIQNLVALLEAGQ